MFYLNACYLFSTIRFKAHKIDVSIFKVSHMDIYPLQVDYEVIRSKIRLYKLFKELPDITACDFEVANKYTDKDKQLVSLKDKLHNTDHTGDIEASALDHPSRTVITHLSIGVSSTKSYVVICDTPTIRSMVYNFLVTTDKLQIWHNTCYDFRMIYHNTGKFPKNYEDSMLMLKCLINNVQTVKALVGLKQVQGYKYGKWAISKDSFTLEEMYEDYVLEYAAIDACATYDLYKQLIGAA